MTKSRGLRAHYRTWTPEDVAILRELYPMRLASVVAARLGRKVESIYAKAEKLGLKKAPEFYAGEFSTRLTGRAGSGMRFVPGSQPWNKGKSYQAGGRSAETRFKPGHRGGRALEKYKPIGSERISADGYLQRKVNDDLPLQQRWKSVHVIVWEATHGPVPKGHLLVFRNRDRADIRLDNLELITLQENMRRNTVHNLPKEVAQAVQLRGALVRKINNRKTETQPNEP
jgi:hypothetical protein